MLGPLVVSAVAFSVPDDRAEECLWTMLGAAVSRRTARRRTKIAIADSKKLYHRKRGAALEHLERAVLAAVATRKTAPASLNKLLALIAPQAVAQRKQYPWYAADLPLPASLSPTDAALAANSLAAAMQAADVRLESMRAEPVFVGEYNRLVEATDNKSTVLFDVTARLLAHLWQRLDGGLLRVCVDRQGGRTRYLHPLQRIFPGCRFKIVQESDAISAYRIADDRRTMEILFAAEAEDRYLPVALASMLAKYLRELCLIQFNAYWTARVPGLAPTAGYYVDGRRFYKQISPAVREMGLDTRLLYRSR